MPKGTGKNSYRGRDRYGHMTLEYPGRTKDLRWDMSGEKAKLRFKSKPQALPKNMFGKKSLKDF